MTPSSRATKDLLLSADERYEIWELKCAERPQLLALDQEEEESADDDGRSSSSCKSSSSSSSSSSCPAVLPLIDGCDLKGWRRNKLVELSETQQSYLNVGTGCSLLRRESQLPATAVPSRSLSQWQGLQRRLLQPPPTTAMTALRIPIGEATLLSHHPWFERENVPVILEGLTTDWKAKETCTLAALVDAWGDYDWRFSDTHGQTVTLKTYNKYLASLEGMSDDAPLAVYDSQLDTDDRRCLLDDYTVPACFDPPDGDLFQFGGKNSNNDDNDKLLDTTFERPPYRWILIGPARSGTGLHVDPLGTHAWVTLMEGVKRWVLFPYGTDPAVIGMQDPQIPSALWFSSEWYERSIRDVPGAIEILQRPGETVYVPAGWPHLVLNLELSTAITHNYATEYPSFERIHLAVKNEEPDMYKQWLGSLRRHRPGLWSKSTAAKATKSTPVPMLN